MTPEAIRDKASHHDVLPGLPFDDWKDTLATLHMWSQIVGKVRLKLCPLVNQWWNVPFYITARGMTTSAMPYEQRAIEVFRFHGPQGDRREERRSRGHIGS
jgi:hypothetical protein